MKNWTDTRFIELPKNYKIWTGRGWSYQRMNKALHRLKKIGFFSQEGRYEFVRTDMTKEQGLVVSDKKRKQKLIRKLRKEREL